MAKSYLWLNWVEEQILAGHMEHTAMGSSSWLAEWLRYKGICSLLILSWGIFVSEKLKGTAVTSDEGLLGFA